MCNKFVYLHNRWEDQLGSFSHLFDIFHWDLVPRCAGCRDVRNHMHCSTILALFFFSFLHSLLVFAQIFTRSWCLWPTVELHSNVNIVYEFKLETHRKSISNVHQVNTELPGWDEGRRPPHWVTVCWLSRRLKLLVFHASQLSTGAGLRFSEVNLLTGQKNMYTSIRANTQFHKKINK